MGFFNPASLWLGLSLAALVAIYLRDRSRPTLDVSSLTLFEPTPAPVMRSRILRIDTLFWLEAAALAALTLLAAGLYLREARPVVQLKRHALIFDLGASMAASGAHGTRLEDAQKKALALVDSAPPGHRFSVIAYALDATIIRAESNHKSDIRRALESLHPFAVTPSQAALGVALTDASNADQIDLFTDHPPPANLIRDARVRATVRVHLVGVPGDNIAIVALESGVPKSVEGRCIVRSFATSPRATDLRIDLGGREVFHSRLMLEPRAQTVVRFGPLPQGGILHARLLQADDLAADNDRYAIAPPVTPATALVVSNDRAVRDDLARILLAVNPSFRVTAIDNSEAALRQQRGIRFDLAVLHENNAVDVNAAARLLIFPQPSNGPTASVQVSSTVAMADLRSRAGSAPLATPVLLGPSRVFTLPGWMEPIATGAAAGNDTNIPLIATGTTSTGAVGVIAFDIRSHLLLDPDKMEALLLSIDAVRHLLQPLDLKVVATGAFVSAGMFAPATLIAPDGSTRRLNPDQWGIVHFKPLDAGRYMVIAGRRAIEVYADYYDAGESDLAGAGSAEPAHSSVQDGGGFRTTMQPIPQDKLLALLVLALLLIESAMIARRSLGWRRLHV